MAQRNLTREEFIQIFGKDPETYKRDHPQRFTPVKKPDVLAQDGVIRTAKNAAAGVLAIPGSVGGIADLARIGVPAIVEGVMSNDNKSVGSRIADKFIDGVMPPETMKALEDKQISAIDKYQKSNPKATQQDIAKFAEDYTGSDEFYQATVDVLPIGLKFAQNNQNWANETVGLNTRADKMSPTDEAAQIAGSALVGLPSSVVNGISRTAAKVLGKRVSQNIATRIAARAIEAVTPLTLPLSAGNIALNAGGGIAINEAVRAYSGQDTIVDYADLYNPERLPEPEDIAAMTGLTAGMFFGVPSISNVVKKQVVNQATNAVAKSAKYINQAGATAAQSLEEQGSKLKPQLGPFVGLIDGNAPIKKAANKFLPAGDTTTIPTLDAAVSSGTHTVRVEAENNALNYGILENLGRTTIPYAEIAAKFERLSPEKKQMFDNYVYAVERKQDSAIYEKSLLDQIKSAQGDLTSATLTGNKKNIQTSYDELLKRQQEYQRLQADDYSSRSSIRQFSRSEINDRIRLGEADPEIKALGDAIRTVSKDTNDFVLANGGIDSVEAAKRNASRELYVKLSEAEYPKDSGLKRRALLFRDKVKNSFTMAKEDQSFFQNTAPRNVTGEGAKVDLPKSAIVALQETIIDAVSNVTVNNARRDAIYAMDALPGARGVIVRPYEFNLGNGKTTTQLSQAQYAHNYPRGIKDESNYTKVFVNGKIELWEMSDKAMQRALAYAPLATIPILNGTRKMWQSGTTGLAAPWFAFRSFMWDPPLAQTTKNADRSLGLIDTFARMAAHGTSMEGFVNKVGGRVFDVTSFASAGLAIPYQLGLRAARAVGIKIADDLSSNSGLFNAIASSGPQGKKYVQAIGTAMTLAFDKSVLAVMSRHMSTSLSHLNDISKTLDDYTKAATSHTGVVRGMFDSYKAMIESVQMSTRTAFFYSNYVRLEQKFNGNVPAFELKKLAQETRNLTGDMSRQSNNRVIQAASSAFPFLNPTLQGTRHIISAAIPQDVAKMVNSVGGNIISDRNTRFWSQFTSGVLLPMLGSASVLSQWNGAEDYWYNQTPAWKQMSAIPFPSIEALNYLAQNGSLPPFNPKYITELNITPEFGLILEPIKAGLRSMGVMGPKVQSVPTQFGSQIKDAFAQLTSLSTPPLLALTGVMSGKKVDIHGMMSGDGIRDIRDTPAGGANADMMTKNSDISMTMYEAVSALTGSAGQLVAQTLNVMDISYEKTDSVLTALEAGLDTAGFEVKRRLPNISVPPLFDARVRLYQTTPESDYVYKTEEALKPIIGSDRQVAVEKDTKGKNALQAQLGLTPANKIRDPNLRQLSMIIYQKLNNKGPYKAADESSSTARTLLASLEASRYKIDDDKYNNKRNQLVKLMQENTRVQSQELQKLESDIQKNLGRRFQQRYGVPFTYETLSKLVRKDVAQ